MRFPTGHFEKLLIASALLLIATAISMPLSRASVGIGLLGLLLAEAALVPALRRWRRPPRQYLELRTETIRMLELVRRMNRSAVELRAAGRAGSAGMRAALREFVNQLHTAVDRLPHVAGKPTRSRLRAIPFDPQP